MDKSNLCFEWKLSFACPVINTLGRLYLFLHMVTTILIFVIARIAEDYPSGDKNTTLENDGPLSTTINAKLTEALSLLQSSRTMPVHREYWCEQCTVF